MLLRQMPDAIANSPSLNTKAEIPKVRAAIMRSMRTAAKKVSPALSELFSDSSIKNACR